MRFAKAHGLGNDFVLVEKSSCPPDAAPWARRLCDRHEGIGGDGVLVYAVEPGRVRMRLINADGSDAEISGNGVRCLAAWAVSRGLVPLRHVVETTPGPRPVVVEPLDAGHYRVATDLGPAILDSQAIPVRLHPPRDRVIDHALESPIAARTLCYPRVDMGTHRRRGKAGQISVRASSRGIARTTRWCPNHSRRRPISWRGGPPAGAPG